MPSGNSAPPLPGRGNSQVTSGRFAASAGNRFLELPCLADPTHTNDPARAEPSIKRRPAPSGEHKSAVPSSIYVSALAPVRGIGHSPCLGGQHSARESSLSSPLQPEGPAIDASRQPSRTALHGSWTSCWLDTPSLRTLTMTQSPIGPRTRRRITLHNVACIDFTPSSPSSRRTRGQSEQIRLSMPLCQAGQELRRRSATPANSDSSAVCRHLGQR